MVSLHQKALQEAPGRRKVVEPTQNKEGFGATLVAPVHSILGSVQWGEFWQHCAGIVKEDMPGLFVEIRHNRSQHGKIPCNHLL